MYRVDEIHDGWEKAETRARAESRVVACKCVEGLEKDKAEIFLNFAQYGESGDVICK